MRTVWDGVTIGVCEYFQRGEVYTDFVDTHIFGNEDGHGED